MLNKIIISHCLLMGLIILPQAGISNAQSKLNTKTAEMPGQFGDIQVNINGLKKANGQLLVSLYSEEKTFQTKDYYQSKTIKIPSTETIKVIFEKIPYGLYAISTYHDANSNGKLDTNIFGIPSEHFGASNDAPAKGGPPKYKDAKFRLEQDMINLTINLK